MCAVPVIVVPVCTSPPTRYDFCPATIVDVASTYQFPLLMMAFWGPPPPPLPEELPPHPTMNKLVMTTHASQNRFMSNHSFSEFLGKEIVERDERKSYSGF